MIIGSFEHNKKDDTYLGDIVTLNFAVERVSFTPNKKKGDKEPDYRIMAPTVVDHVELGAGWKRVSQKGQAFISVELDGPLMGAKLYARLFTDEGGKAALVWSRQKHTKSDTPAEEAA